MYFLLTWNQIIRNIYMETKGTQKKINSKFVSSSVAINGLLLREKFIYIYCSKIEILEFIEQYCKGY